jgi:hypothetical protein
MSPLDETRLRQLLDRAEISEIQIRYATGTDSRNWELFRTCFADDLEVDFSSGFGIPVVSVTADEWVKNTASTMGVLKATQHMITNHVIMFDDEDNATCVAYVRASHHNPNNTGDSDQTVYGFYTNRFERTSSGWRIAKLKLTVSWMTGNFGLFGHIERNR